MGAVAARGGLQADGVGAVVGFGERERADRVERGHAGQPALLLLLAAEQAIEPIVRPDCTPMNVLTLPSPRDISRVTMPAASRDRPGQP